MPSVRVIVANVGHAKSPDAIARRLRQLLPAHGRWVVLGCEGHRYAGQLDPLGGTVHQEPFDRSKARIPWENPDRGRAEVFVITGPDVDVDGAEAEQIMAGPNPPTKYQSDRWVQRVYTHVDGVPLVFVSWHGQANIQRGGVVNPLSAMARDYKTGVLTLADRAERDAEKGYLPVIGGDANYRDTPQPWAGSPFTAFRDVGLAVRAHKIDQVATDAARITWDRDLRVVDGAAGTDHQWLVADIRTVKGDTMPTKGFMPGVIAKNIPPGANDPEIVPVGGVCHVAVSEGKSLYDYFNGPSGGVESHFHVRRDGTKEQYRSIYYEADANYKGSSFLRGGKRCGLVSIETQGMGEGEWTDEQLTSIKEIMTWCHEEAGVALKVIDRWDGDGWGYHIQFGAPGPWTPSVKTCPGPDRIVQFKKVLAPWLNAGGRDPEPKLTRVESGRALVQQGIDILNETPEPRKGAKRLAAALAAVLADEQYPKK